MQNTLSPAASRPAGADSFPLSPEEVARFVAGWLAAAGRPRNLVEPEAVLALAQHSGGSLQRVDELAEAALALAERDGAPCVLGRHVHMAASARDGADLGGGIAFHRDEAALSAPVGVEPAQAGTVTDDAEASYAQAPGQRRRRALRWLAAAGLAVLLAAGTGWVLSEWLFSLEKAHVADRSRPAALPREETGVPATAAAVQPQPPADQQARPASHTDAGAPDAPPAVPSAPAPTPTVTADAGQPAPAEASLPDAPTQFRGVVTNETMGQSGQMSLVVTRQGPSGAVTAQFRAWGGLIGAGELSGRLSQDGHLSLSGQLMMGRNPFDCELSGRIAGERLLGSATFARTGGTYSARSSFTLTRSDGGTAQALPHRPGRFGPPSVGYRD